MKAPKVMFSIYFPKNYNRYRVHNNIVLYSGLYYITSGIVET